jgi:hypothetical protein
VRRRRRGIHRTWQLRRIDQSRFNTGHIHGETNQTQLELLQGVWIDKEALCEMNDGRGFRRWEKVEAIMNPRWETVLRVSLCIGALTHGSTVDGVSTGCAVFTGEAAQTAQQRCRLLKTTVIDDEIVQHGWCLTVTVLLCTTPRRTKIITQQRFFFHHTNHFFSCTRKEIFHRIFFF